MNGSRRDPGNASQPTHSASPEASGKASWAPSSSSGQTSQGAVPSLLPTLSLPKGGGAIRGLGEKFSANPATGTSSLSIPIATTPGRGGFGPQLALSYESSAGNGAFGLGWQLSLPEIRRKTDKGVPRYLDLEGDGDEADVFVLGGEDLVPMLAGDGGVFDDAGFRIQRYRPRVEGAFARIERFTHKPTRTTSWRILSRDNVLSVYGETEDTRVYDPESPERVARWLLQEMRDDRGNVIFYQYKTEDGAQVDRGRASESHRFASVPGASWSFLSTSQRYLKRVYYGNRTPVARDEGFATEAPDFWLFELVFDYGEHDDAAPTPHEMRPWSVRPDPFSSYRAGFEQRTYRLCRRALMFHRFEELGPTPYLVRSTDFTYEAAYPYNTDSAFIAGPIAMCLTAAEHAGYLRDPGGTYQRAALPPLELSYIPAAMSESVGTIARDEGHGVPGTARGGAAQWIDLDGEGIPGSLISSEGAWYYRPNLGGGRLGPPVLQRSWPSLDVAGMNLQLVDVDGDGRLELARYAPEPAGFFQRTAPHQWERFTPFHQLPHLDWNDPNLRFLDLDGDGLPDLLITHDDELLWHRSAGKEGFATAARLSKSRDEREGPALLFADASETIHLADLNGDGLIDLVRTRNGEVCYWPNLGHGRFGAKVTLDASPFFDTAELFDPRLVRFADLDGSGPSDLLYLGRHGLQIYFNCSGNSLSAPLSVRSLPPADALSNLAVVDLLGRGTACLVWTSATSETGGLFYLELFGEKKPYLLESLINNLGAETRLTYAPSTKFYLEDQAAGRPWLTRLPFPVHVIERIEHFDHVIGSKLVTRYRYHHGLYDGHERELGGFACVEQWDAESFREADTELALYSPPVRTVTWFHTGAWIGRDDLIRALQREFYAGDSAAPSLPPTLLPTGLTTDEEREAVRALRGAVLRQEIYAEDDLPQSEHPYSVSESSYQLRVLQRRHGNRNAVFFLHPSESLQLHYERASEEPRVQHEMVLAVDDFGNVLQRVSLSYPRRVPQHPEQGVLWAVLSEQEVINRADQEEWLRLGAPLAASQSELTGFTTGPSGLVTADDLRGWLPGATEIPFEDTPPRQEMERRLLKRSRIRYLRDDLTAPLPFGQIESLAIPYETYEQVFTPGLLSRVYGSQVSTADLQTLGRYVEMDGAWWAPSGRVVLDPQRFYIPVETIDPFGQHSLARYDAHALLLLDTEDPLHNRVTVGLRDATGAITQNGYDYRTLSPVLLTDPNSNRVAVEIDALGMVIKMAVLGKDGAGEGDSLSSPTSTFEYNLHRWRTSGGVLPVYAKARAREIHGSPSSFWHDSYVYSDGSGREIMRKVRAESGPVPLLDEDGHLLRNPDGSVQTEIADKRWIGNGRTVFDNKGNAVKQYEPFFSATYEYEDEQELVEWGVTPVLHYDPLGRLVRTDLPDGTYTKVVFDVWRQEAWDANDTVADSDWLTRQLAGDATAQRAAALSLAHAGTPTVSHLDSLGRAFLSVANNGARGLLSTHVTFDVQSIPRATTDPRGIPVATQVIDQLGRPIAAVSPDAGDTSAFYDVAGKPVFQWTARGHRIRTTFDLLQRPLEVFVRESTLDPEVLRSRVVYGEAHPYAETLNLRGAAHQLYDGAGVVVNERFDFKGNLLESARQLGIDPRVAQDWTPLAGLTSLGAIETAAAPQLESETFTSTVAYDALNRPYQNDTPDGSIITTSYNRAGVVSMIESTLRGGSTYTTFLDGVETDAYGRRTRSENGNGVYHETTYDPDTSRLTSQRSTRASDNRVLQDLQYVYDAAGNIVQVSDAVSFGNATVSATGLYEYDSIYQLVKADGREHPGQQPNDQDSPLLRLDHPNDLQALRRYRETYSYDASGNLEELSHQPLGSGPSGWTRRYSYATTSNRLLATSLPGDLPSQYSAIYSYDVAGCWTSMPHLSTMRWDFASRLTSVDRGGGGQVFFVYDSSGQRVRKTYDHGAYLEERIYLGGYELYRKRNRATLVLELERQTLTVDTCLVETKTADTSVPSFTPTPRLRYQLSNHLGTTTAELDEIGAVITYEETHPYGTTAFHASHSATEVSARRYRYTGQERDDETGLSYHSARYYTPWLGRWAAPDPIGIGDGTNVYCYVRNSPTRYADETGNWAGGSPVSAPPTSVWSPPPPTNCPLPTPPAAPAPIPASTPAPALPTPSPVPPVPTPPSSPSPMSAPGPGAGAPIVAVGGTTLAVEFFQILNFAVTVAGTGASIGLTGKLTFDRSIGTFQFGNVYGVPSSELLNPYKASRRRRQEHEVVNLDTGAIIAATQRKDFELNRRVSLLLVGKNLVATRAVIEEFMNGPFQAAGFEEKLMVYALFLRITPIDNDPSQRVIDLVADSKAKKKLLGPVDRIAFGTGDKRNILTVTGDGDFVKEARRQGVHLYVYVHAPARYARE